MDLSPLYELRARLRAAMIAGTNLLGEDFRLQRAAEAFAPLEQASPVFAKIGQMTRGLLAPDQKDREGALLDAITLADAVLCTQGAVSAAGEVEPIQGSSWGSAVTNAPYSVVKTLLDALSNSGGGRYGYVLETHKERPELFEDYRIKAAMVQALGASYAELAETVAEWLQNEDKAILPLLQKDFDPKGKKEMVRRIRVMAAVDAGEANDFFRKVLPDAEKEVRQSLIYALQYCPENTELLLELSRTEKGNARKMVYYALASMEEEKAEEAFVELYQKKPAEAMQYLIYAQTKWASRFVADRLKEQLAPWVADEGFVLSKEQAALLDATLAALPGKSGGEVCEAFRLAMSLEDRLKYPFGDRKTVWVGEMVSGMITACVTSGNRRDVVFGHPLLYLLYQALCFHPDDGLCGLALELYEGEGGRKEYFPLAVTAMLLSGGDCCDWLEEQLWKKGLLGQKKNSELYLPLARGLDRLAYGERSGTYVLLVNFGLFRHPSGEPMPSCFHPVRQEITGRFTDILMKCEDLAVDAVLRRCIDVRNVEYCRKLGDYFYKRALEVKDNRVYLPGLKRCGYPKCEGLACHYFTVNWQSNLYMIERYAAELPGDGASKYAEMNRVHDMVLSGKLVMSGYAWDEDRFMRMLENLRNS